MGLSIGIVGLPNVGKSTLFNALTKSEVDAANYPFCTIDPSVGVVPVPDPRLDVLTKFSNSKKTVPAVVEFVDIAGLVKGASEGEGLGNQFLSHIRETDAIAQVVRVFEGEKITHVHGNVDPVSDIGVINAELALADLSVVEKRLSGLEREIKAGKKEAAVEQEALTKVREGLLHDVPVRRVMLSEEERRPVQLLNLLTAKPLMYILNIETGGKNLHELNDVRWQKLKTFLEAGSEPYVFVDAQTENDMKHMSTEERAAFQKELGIDVGGVNAVITAGYTLLDLITFLTTGEAESRAWTVKRNATAPEAGAAIHSDFRDKFIRAQVISYDDLIACGSYAAAREKGVLRTEGKEYIVKDGDVIEFLI